MTAFELALFALATLAGVVAAVAGFGIGSLLTPVLGASVGIQTAVALVSVPHAVATATRLWTLRDSIDRGLVRSFGLASAGGGLAGAALHGLLASPALGLVLGGLLVLSGALELTGLNRRLPLSGRAAYVAGLLSGGFGGLVGNQGGIRSAALLHAGLSTRALVATATATAMLVDVARVPVYVFTNAPDLAANVRTVAILTGGVILGTLLGAPVLRRLPESHLRRLLAAGLVALGSALLAGWGS